MSWQGGHKDLLADVSYVSCGTSGDSWILRPEELSAASESDLQWSDLQLH